jgi:endonuclease/exonuclease/phosphatase family metal-dependent hydrolase
METSRSRALVAAVIGAAGLCGCSSVRAAAEWIASPALQAVGAEETDDDCEEHPHRVPPLATDRKLRIGTWNMHYLGPSAETPREERDLGRLAEYIALSGVSVLALQEIGVCSAGDGGNPTLDEIFLRLGDLTGGDWTYVLFGSEDPAALVGLSWNRNLWKQVGRARPVRADGDPPGLFGFIPLPLVTKLWPRPPYAVELSAGDGLTDVVFVPVHLAARIELYFFEDGTAHRTAEADSLAEALPGVIEEFHDRDVVILGDFNIELSTEGATEALLAHGWRDLNCANFGTHHFNLPLDRIFVPDDQPEFGLPRNFFRVSPPEATSWLDFADRWSDHMLVVADVLIGRDDD